MQTSKLIIFPQYKPNIHQHKKIEPKIIHWDEDIANFMGFISVPNKIYRSLIFREIQENTNSHNIGNFPFYQVWGKQRYTHSIGYQLKYSLRVKIPKIKFCLQFSKCVQKSITWAKLTHQNIRSCTYTQIKGLAIRNKKREKNNSLFLNFHIHIKIERKILIHIQS